MYVTSWLTGGTYLRAKLSIIKLQFGLGVFHVIPTGTELQVFSSDQVPHK